MSSAKKVFVGHVQIGGGAPVSIQSMCNADPGDPVAVARQVAQLAEAGCDIVRIAVPDMRFVPAALETRRLTKGIPLVADVHFDHRVAIALAGHFDKIRLNPGTLRGREALLQTAGALAATGTPVRIGTNSGSLPEDVRTRYPDPAEALVEAAARMVGDLADLGVTDVVVSVKSSSPVTTVRAYEIAASRLDVPLHLGVTESGTLLPGAVRSASVMGSLLARGIGDTIRVSLAGPPLPEVQVAREILSSLGLRKPGVQVRACPGCGRTRIDTAAVAAVIEEAVSGIQMPQTVIAVMGCEVNGPGEAREADMAIVGTAEGAALYKDGVVVSRGTPGEIAAKLSLMLQRGQD